MPSPTMTRRSSSIPRTAFAFNNRGFAYGAKERTTINAIADYDQAIQTQSQVLPLPTTTGASPTASRANYDHAIADYDQAIQSRS